MHFAWHSIPLALAPLRRAAGVGTLLAAWLGGCALPPADRVASQEVPQAVPDAVAVEAASAPWVAAVPREPALTPRRGPAEPALRIKPEREPGEAPGDPALRLPAPSSPEEPPVLLASGTASWYADSLHGRRTANGERYDREEFTAAHRSLPFGARLCVRSLVNGRTVLVRVNDRGPFVAGRIIDLSRAAAQELGMTGLGIKSVELWRLGAEEDACPDELAQPEEGARLGLDAAAADKALQPSARKAPAPARPKPKRRGRRSRR